MLLKQLSASPLIHAVWDDKFGREIPIDSRKRTTQQISYLDELTDEIIQGHHDILQHAFDCAKQGIKPVVATPEYAAATGLPISEEQMERVVEGLHQSLINGGDSMHCHFSSMLVHYTGKSRLLGDKLSPFNENQPILINMALIGKKEGRKTKINLFYKQVIDPNDFFYEYRHHPDILENPNSINFDRIMNLDRKEEISVSEICLENKAGVGFVSVAKRILQEETNSSVNIESYRGYQLLMSDTIDFLQENAAFNLIVHCDARQAPTVRLIRDDNIEELIKQTGEHKIYSKSRIASEATLHAFEPVRLYPLREGIKQYVEDLREEEPSSKSPSP